MEKTSLKIENKEIDLKNWLTTLKKDDCKNNVVEITAESYSELGYTLNSLISVCQTALFSFNENQSLTEVEKENVLGCSSLDIANVLGLAKKLIPASELDLLTEMQQEQK